MENTIIFCILLITYLNVHYVRAHSWLVCTDYTVKNDDDYKPEYCRGFPRAANRFLSKEFGKETGYDHQPTEDLPCKQRRNDPANYDFQYPMAVYYPGQQVVLAHPMKEHGADKQCTSIFIPDSGSWIYRSQKNLRADPPMSHFLQNLVFDLGVSPLGNEELSSTYPKPGFQNAPAYCLNIDKSLGTYSFNVPLDLEPGLYTFMWIWAFNNMNDLFSTCFEVRVVANQIQRNRILQQNGFTDLSEPCGGYTSNPAVSGVCNYVVSEEEPQDGQDPGGNASRIKLNFFLAFYFIIPLWILL